MLDCAFLSRIINLGRDYASKRVAFGKFLKDHPLHIQTMARMEVRSQCSEQDLSVIPDGKKHLLQ